MLAFLAAAAFAAVAVAQCPGIGEADLSVYVDSASVKDADIASKSDPYCRVSAGGHEKKTSTKSNTNNPHWHETLHLGCVEPLVTTIRVHCLDDDGSADKDDELLDEHLPAEDWYVAGENGQFYELGGSNHHVKIAVSWVETTAAPSVSPAPTPVPTPVPTSLPSAVPTLSNQPTPKPTSLLTFLDDGVQNVQLTDSKLYDSGEFACYDSPVRGRRVQLDDVQLVASQFLVSSHGGPWHGVRLLLEDDEGTPLADDENASFSYDARGTVVEVEGETALANAVLVRRNDSASVRELPFANVSTADFAGGCGSLTAESLEGVPVVVQNAQAVVLTADADRAVLAVDDGSGPSLAVVPQPAISLLSVDETLVVTTLRGVVVYERVLGADEMPFYALLATDVAFISVEAFTGAPTAAATTLPTLSPTTALPTTMPTPAHIALLPASSSSHHRGSNATWIVLLVCGGFVLCGVACLWLLRDAPVWSRFFRNQSSNAPPRRPYSSSRSARISELTFEMGVVEAIGYDPNDAAALSSAAAGPHHGSLPKSRFAGTAASSASAEGDVDDEPNGRSLV